MARWTGIILALPSSRPDGMVSRLPAYLHPIAGRPLVWHVASSLAEAATPPDRVVVMSEGDLPAELFQDIPLDVESYAVLDPEGRQRQDIQALAGDEGRWLAVHASAVMTGDALNALLETPTGSWLAGGSDAAAAVHTGPDHLSQLLRLPDPFEVPNGSLASSDALSQPHSTTVVRNREQLVEVSDRIRRHLVRAHMAAGVTFLLPDTVLVDVDVRIGRDSIIYPGVVLEGATTVGEETVLGPGCRVIDSWIGSGVELRGWNYISHTSIRNRAILEPYVRRGFD